MEQQSELRKQVIEKEEEVCRLLAEIDAAADLKANNVNLNVSDLMQQTVEFRSSPNIY